MKKTIEELKEEVKEKLKAMPIASSCHLSTQLLASHSTMNCVMRKVVYPYKIQVLQELKPLDYGKYVNFCYWLLHYVYHHHYVLDTTFFSGKVWFHLSGRVNMQNLRLVRHKSTQIHKRAGFILRK